VGHRGVLFPSIAGRSEVTANREHTAVKPFDEPLQGVQPTRVSQENGRRAQSLGRLRKRRTEVVAVVREASGNADQRSTVLTAC
jgi:hypothetical protein